MDDYYAVNANAGDHLHFATTTPADGPGEFANNFYPELVLYDNTGTLVAIANGNAADGRNSVIDLAVPSSGAGTWTIEVSPSPSTSQPTRGEYGLSVTGETSAPVNAYRVVALFDQTESHNSGSTIPIKIQLFDGNGRNVGSPNLPVTAVEVIDPIGNLLPLQSPGNSQPGNRFTYDPSTGTYQFNLKTTG